MNINGCVEFTSIQAANAQDGCVEGFNQAVLVIRLCGELSVARQY